MELQTGEDRQQTQASSMLCTRAAANKDLAPAKRRARSCEKQFEL